MDLSQPIPGLPAAGDETGDTAWVLVRVGVDPAGLLEIPLRPEEQRPIEVLRTLQARLDKELREHLRPVGVDLSDLTVDGLPAGAALRNEQIRQLAEPAEPCTVVICTRDRPDGLARTLRSLTRQVVRPAQVIVVDNAPTTDASQRVTEEYAPTLDLLYLVEPRPGLSRARNRALRTVQTPLVAWLDDDTEADTCWLAQIARCLTEETELAGLSGVVVPLALETEEQVLFERFGGHSKGRGFDPMTFSPVAGMTQSPLYPLPPFGVGANMAFRTADLRAIGGFDEALGAGTLTRAGEDTLVFTQLLLRGRPLAYRPSALVRHLHRSDLDQLGQQLRGYGTGLTAFYTALALERPTIVLELLGLLPRGLRDLFSSESPRSAGLGESFPDELMRRNRSAMLLGPIQYLRQRRLNSRIGSARGRPDHDDLASAVPTSGPLSGRSTGAREG